MTRATPPLLAGVALACLACAGIDSPEPTLLSEGPIMGLCLPDECGAVDTNGAWQSLSDFKQVPSRMDGGATLGKSGHTVLLGRVEGALVSSPDETKATWSALGSDLFSRREGTRTRTFTLHRADGSLAHPANYQFIGPISEGLMVTRDLETGLATYRDPSTLAPVLEGPWKRASPFSSGLACVRMQDDTDGLIDRSGRLVLPAVEVCVNTGDGYAWTQDGRQQPAPGKDPIGGWQVVDTSGNVTAKLGLTVKALNPLEPLPFKEGRSVARHQNNQLGFFEPNGTFHAVPEGVVSLSSLSQGLAVAVTAAGEVGYLDPDAQWALPPSWTPAHGTPPTGKTDHLEGISPQMSFAEGLAAARTKGGLWGYINPKGEWVIQPELDWAEGFKDGFARVQQGGVEKLLRADGTELELVR